MGSSRFIIGAPPGPFNPLTIPGLTGLHYSDDLAAGNVASWPNRRNVGSPSTQGNVLQQPVMVPGSWSDGGPAVLFQNANDLHLLNPLIAAALANGAPSAHFALLRLQALAIDQNVFGAGGAGVPLVELYCANDDHFASSSTNDAGINNAAEVAALGSLTDDQLVAWSRDGAGNMTIIVNGVSETFAACDPVPPQTLTAGAIGTTLIGGAAPNNSLSALMRNCGWGTQALSPVDYNNLAKLWLGGLFYQNVCDGNSLTLGTGSSGPGFTYPAQLQALNGFRFITQNEGIGPQTTVDMITNFAAAGHPGAVVLPAPMNNILIGWEIANDILLNAADTGTALSNWEAYVTLGKAAGYQVISLTVIPQVTFTPAQNVIVSQCNTALLANPQNKYGTAICNVAGLPQLQDFTDLTYFDPDQIHLNDNGYGIVAQAVQTTQSTLGFT